VARWTIEGDLPWSKDYKLPLLEQLFLTLVRLRLDDPEQDLTIRFGLSQSCVSRITATWINLLYHSLKGLECFPPWQIVQKYMPIAFKEQYPNTRLIIDCTEFGIEHPSSLATQTATFSLYKNKNCDTIKNHTEYTACQHSEEWIVLLSFLEWVEVDMGIIEQMCFLQLSQ